MTFRDWLRTQGVPDAHLDTYQRIADHLQAVAGAGTPVQVQHLELAVRQQEQAGATPQTITNIRRIAEKLIAFHAAQPRAEPASPSASGPSSGTATKAEVEAWFMRVVHHTLYGPLVFHAHRRIGIKSGGYACTLTIDPRTGNPVAHEFPGIPPERWDVDCWLEVEPGAIAASMSGGSLAGGLKISTGPKGLQGSAANLRLLTYALVPESVPPEVPLEDREDLVYGALFGGVKPAVVEASPSGSLRALKYARAFAGRDVLVTSGFSNTGLGGKFPPSAIKDQVLMGFELVLLCDPHDTPKLEPIFKGWVGYASQGHALLPPDWLMEPKGNYPGTDLAGFLVVIPKTLPWHFPVGRGVACVSVLLGARREELEIAGRDDEGFHRVRQALEGKGWIDSSPAKRPSALR